WVPAGALRSWCSGDLVVDWLAEYGEQHGFRRDDQQPGYQRAFDLPRFLMQKGREFERAVLADLGTRWPIARIAERPDQARSLAAAEATLDAMAAGAPVIAAAVLRDPQARTYGVADLLLRSDVLGQLCPGARVGRDAFVRSRDQDLGDIVADGLAWIRRVRTEGAEWRVLPVPSVPELWPNMKAEGDFPWHHAKAQIAAQLGDLTILPRVNAE